MERAHFRRQAETSDAQLVPTRPAGVLLRVPRSVGNPTVDTACKTVHSTTLFQKYGVLRGETPKLTFAYFCSATKVGPRRVGTLSLRQGCRNKHAPTAKPKPGRAGSGPRPTRYRYFWLSATASSSHRLLYGFSAWVSHRAAPGGSPFDLTCAGRVNRPLRRDFAFGKMLARRAAPVQGHAGPATGTSGSPPPPARRTDCCRDSPRGP